MNKSFPEENETVETLPTRGRSEDRVESDEVSCIMDFPSNNSKCAPVFMQSQFMLPENLEIADTYFWPIDLTKGIVYLNGHCLGRYWPGMGPQLSLYVPGVWFNPPPRANTLIVLELEPKPCVIKNNCRYKFHKKPKGMELDLVKISTSVRSRSPENDVRLDSEYGLPLISTSSSNSSSASQGTPIEDAS